ncbi:RPL23B [Symbiodinium natans]|uniref:RPL23B protein n=1 Tax=Symbiodinium natans TaxID=878477 RepID=A0A812QTP9_9DINO|nr:RPL23B [Symbiodinium natans]
MALRLWWLQPTARRSLGLGFRPLGRKHLRSSLGSLLAVLALLSLPALSLQTSFVPAGYGGYRRVSQALRAKPAEPDLTSPAWVESAEVILDIIEDSTKEDALEWLQAGFAWTQKSRRFWRKLRSEAPPEPAAVRSTARWLQDKGLAQKAWVRRFPEVLGLSVKELEEGKKTAPSYLKSDEIYNKAIKSNPTLLGKNYDCLLEHESCQGRCSRCWNT